MTLATIIADSVSSNEGVRLSTALVRIPRADQPFMLGGLCSTRIGDDRVLVTGVGSAFTRFIETRRFGALRTMVRDLERALVASSPADLDLGCWHLPWIDNLAVEQAAEHVFDHGPPEGFEYGHLMQAITTVATQMSVARCFHLSWCSEFTVEEHLDAYARVIQQGRFDAAEHQATPDTRKDDLSWCRPHYHGRLPGWQQHRKMIVGENLRHLQAAE